MNFGRWDDRLSPMAACFLYQALKNKRSHLATLFVGYLVFALSVILSTFTFGGILEFINDFADPALYTGWGIPLLSWSLPLGAIVDTVVRITGKTTEEIGTENLELLTHMTPAEKVRGEFLFMLCFGLLVSLSILPAVLLHAAFGWIQPGKALFLWMIPIFAHVFLCALGTVALAFRSLKLFGIVAGGTVVISITSLTLFANQNPIAGIFLNSGSDLVAAIRSPASQAILVGWIVGNVALARLLLAVSTAINTPPTLNRVAPVRREALVSCIATLVVTAGCAAWTGESWTFVVWAAMWIVVAACVVLVSPLEPQALTRAANRRLPRNKALRLLSFPLMPGVAPGLVFSLGMFGLSLGVASAGLPPDAIGYEGLASVIGVFSLLYAGALAAGTGTEGIRRFLMPNSYRTQVIGILAGLALGLTLLSVFLLRLVVGFDHQDRTIDFFEIVRWTDPFHVQATSFIVLLLGLVCSLSCWGGFTERYRILGESSS